MQGTSVIGCISDTDPQPLLIRSCLGTFAISTIGIINNASALIDQYLSFSGGHFDAMTGGKVNSTELTAALINQKDDLVSGISELSVRHKLFDTAEGRFLHSSPTTTYHQLHVASLAWFSPKYKSMFSPKAEAAAE